MRSGGAAEEQFLYVPADFRTQHIVRNVLIVAAGDQDHLFGEAPQAGDGAAGAGGNGVVIVPDAVLDANQFKNFMVRGECFKKIIMEL